MWIIIASIIALVAGSFLLALVSDAFADALSRSVESVFDFLEYKAALRNARTQANAPHRAPTAYAPAQTTLARAA